MDLDPVQDSVYLGLAYLDLAYLDMNQDLVLSAPAPALLPETHFYIPSEALHPSHPLLLPVSWHYKPARTDSRTLLYIFLRPSVSYLHTDSHSRTVHPAVPLLPDLLFSQA